VAEQTSISQNDPPPLGWGLLTALGCALIISWGTIYYSFALLMQPMQRALGASQSLIVGAYSAALLLTGLAAPWIGRLIDREGGRRVMTAGSILAVACFAALSRVESIWALYAIWIGLGLSMAATLYEPAFAVVTQLAGTRYRRAITVLTLFGGVASTVFWPVIAVLLERYGWRLTALWLAAFNLPCVWVHARMLPSVRATKLTEAAPARVRLPLSSTSFIALALALLAQAIAITALSVHLLPLLTSRGLSLAQAAAVGALFGPMQVVGRVLEMMIGARASAIAVGRVVVLMLPAAVLVLLHAGDEVPLLVLYAVLYGIGNGTMTIVRGAVPVELWGRENYGALMGWLAFPAMVARASGPLLASFIWTAAGGYDAVLWSLLGFVALAVVAFYVAVGRR
jgi:MFS family permease